MIVNPSSGPGSTQFPDEDYSTAIKNLTGYSNVEVVGYVRTGYATRNISAVIADVDTYAGWASNSSALAMDGIFFDEAPYEYSAAAVEYMRTANEAVNKATGLQEPRTVSWIPALSCHTSLSLSLSLSHTQPLLNVFSKTICRNFGY